VDETTIRSKGIISNKELSDTKNSELDESKHDNNNDGFLKNIGNAFKKAIDCCKE
jgi:hypothetical protein